MAATDPAGAVVYTWLYNNTRRSVLGAIAFHFAGTITGEVIGLVPELYAYSFVGTVLVAAIVTVRWGAETLRRGDRPVPGPARAGGR